MTPHHRAINSHTKGSLGFRSDFAFGVRKKERFTGPTQDLSVVDEKSQANFGFVMTSHMTCNSRVPWTSLDRTYLSSLKLKNPVEAAKRVSPTEPADQHAARRTSRARDRVGTHASRRPQSAHTHGSDARVPTLSRARDVRRAAC